MRFPRYLTILSVLLLLTPAAIAADPAPAKAPEKILMIGNSLTYTYGIPAILENLAAAGNHKLTVTAHVAGGKGLAWHWETPNKEGGLTAKQAIEKGGYDLVILQEYSNALRKEDGQESFKKIAPEYLKAIHAKSMQAMLYMAHPTAQTVNAASLKPAIEAYTHMADDLGVVCAPAALAFIQCNEKQPKLALIDLQKDRKYALEKAKTHQSPFGSYVAACTLYSAIYNESPVGLKFYAAFDGKTKVEFEPADAKAAQEIAWEVWQDYSKSRSAAKKPATTK